MRSSLDPEQATVHIAYLGKTDDWQIVKVLKAARDNSQINNCFKCNIRFEYCFTNMKTFFNKMTGICSKSI